MGQKKDQKKGLKSFIEEQIRKTGFLTEIDVIEELEPRGWDYVSPYQYFDHDETKWREMDMVPFKCFPDISGMARYRLCVDLIIECKKRVDYAWVFVTRPMSTEDALRRIFDIDCFDLVGVAKSLLSAGSELHHGVCPYAYQWITDDIIEEMSSTVVCPGEISRLKDVRELGLIQKEMFKYFTTSRIGLYGKEIKTSRQGGKADSGISQIFASLVTVNKALTHLAHIDYTAACNELKRVTGLGLTPKGSFLSTIEVLIPLVVFDGHLYSWDEQHGVVEQNSVLARSLYASSQYRWRRLVPVVKAEYFPNFLESLGRDLDQVYQAISRRLDEIDKQTKSLVFLLSKVKRQRI